MTKKSSARLKRTYGEAIGMSHSERKPGIFGTLFQPVVRWWCSRCDAANTTKMKVPLRAKELVPCHLCHRMTVLTLEVNKLPQCWGGPEVLPEGAAPSGSLTVSRGSAPADGDGDNTTPTQAT